MITKIRKKTLIIVILVLSIVFSIESIRIGSEAFIAQGHIAKEAYIRYLLSFIFGTLELIIGGVYGIIFFKFNKSEKTKSILNIIFISIIVSINIALLIIHSDMSIRIIKEYLVLMDDPIIPIEAVNSYKRFIIMQILEIALIVIQNIMLLGTYIIYVKN